jgi:ribonuclease P/MRP protein subunit POP5
MFKAVRQRYLAVKIDSEQFFEERDIIDAVWRSVFQLFGEYGASQTRLFLVCYDKQSKQAILRCSLQTLPLVRASITSITKVNSEPVAIHVLRVSGTIKALLDKLKLKA